jgi:hypothetical protein
MAFHAEVEAPKSVARETVPPTLENDGFGTVVLHHAFDHGFEDSFVGLVVDTIAEGEVDCVVLALTDADVTKLASPREVLAVLVERDRHDAISGVERLLDSITVMNIDVDVENTLLEAEEFDDAEDDV